jgi:hypothetical protein
MFLQVAEIKKALTTVRGHLHAMRNHQYLFSASMLKVRDPNTSLPQQFFYWKKGAVNPGVVSFSGTGKLSEELER